MNHDKIQEAFQRYPMCDGNLSQQLSKRGRYAVCAVGALICNVGKVKPVDLLDQSTEDMIDQHFPDLKATYGFKTKRQVLEFVDVNDDLGEVSAVTKPELIDNDQYYWNHKDRYVRGSNESVRSRLLHHVAKLKSKVRKYGKRRTK